MNNRPTNAKETEQYLQNLLEEVVTETVTLPEPEHIEITANYNLHIDKVNEIRDYLDTAIAAGKPVSVYIFNQ